MKNKSLILSLLFLLCVSVLLCACGNPFAKKGQQDAQTELDMKTLEGVYSEVQAHRGVLQLSARDSQTVDVVINWPGSAFENAHWEMSGTYDADKQAIVYSDASLIEQTFDEQGTQTDRQISSNGTGSFAISGSNLLWTDDNAYIGSDPATFAYTMSLGDYMKNQQTAAATPTPTPTPEPTPLEEPVVETGTAVDGSVTAETPASPLDTSATPLEDNPTGAVAQPNVPGSPVVTKSPTDETVKPGGSCWFVAEHNGAQLARWRFISPEGQDMQYDEAGKLFPNMQILQGEYSHMKLVNIPADLDGWRVYCRYSNKAGSIDTKTATIHVTADGNPGVNGAAGAPTVTKSPTDETVKPGGTCYFNAKHTGAQLARWHFVSPDGQTDVQYDEAAKLFPDLVIKNGEYDTMQLKNIQSDLDGWRVYCRFSNKAGAVDSGMATITVKADTTA
ncbi:MAG: hypothetical protein IKS55_09465 [Oscillospiraceae bacterium]|nr:hypothetical protein [Oscillospiraceae bacterium]